LYIIKYNIYFILKIYLIICPRSKRVTGLLIWEWHSGNSIWSAMFFKFYFLFLHLIILFFSNFQLFLIKLELDTLLKMWLNHFLISFSIEYIIFKIYFQKSLYLQYFLLPKNLPKSWEINAKTLLSSNQSQAGRFL